MLKILVSEHCRTICYVLSLFESLLHVLYDSALPSFFFSFFLSSLFFLSLFFFLCCLLMFTRFQFYFPFVLTFFAFPSSQNFSYGYFSTFQTYISQHFFFFLTQLTFDLLGLFQDNFHLIL